MLLEPEMWDLISIAMPRIRTSWENLSYSMGYSIEDVKGFRGEGKDLDVHCHKLFENWLTSRCGCTPKTWGKLLERIKEVDDIKVAAEATENKLSAKH